MLYLVHIYDHYPSEKKKLNHPLSQTSFFKLWEPMVNIRLWYNKKGRFELATYRIEEKKSTNEILFFNGML